jgi:hypothetical protein
MCEIAFLAICSFSSLNDIVLGVIVEGTVSNALGTADGLTICSILTAFLTSGLFRALLVLIAGADTATSLLETTTFLKVDVFLIGFLTAVVDLTGGLAFAMIISL